MGGSSGGRGRGRGGGVGVGVDGRWWCMGSAYALQGQKP